MSQQRTIEYSVQKRGKTKAKQAQLTAACVLRHFGRPCELYERGRYESSDPEDHDSYGGNKPTAFGLRVTDDDHAAWSAFVANADGYRAYLRSDEFRKTWTEVVRDDNSED